MKHQTAETYDGNMPVLHTPDVLGKKHLILGRRLDFLELAREIKAQASNTESNQSQK